MVIPWQFCRTIGPLILHSQEINIKEHLYKWHTRKATSNKSVSQYALSAHTGYLKNKTCSQFLYSPGMSWPLAAIGPLWEVPSGPTTNHVTLLGIVSTLNYWENSETKIIIVYKLLEDVAMDFMLVFYQSTEGEGSQEADCQATCRAVPPSSGADGRCRRCGGCGSYVSCWSHRSCGCFGSCGCCGSYMSCQSYGSWWSCGRYCPTYSPLSIVWQGQGTPDSKSKADNDELVGFLVSHHNLPTCWAIQGPTVF